MSTKNIHKTAIVSEDAKIHPTATVGPFAVVEGDVEIGARTVLGPHAVVRQFTRIGEDNIIDPNAIIGGLPQHAGFDGSESWVIVGNNNVFREGVTVNRAYQPGSATRIGSGCFLMANAHVGHDCVVEGHQALDVRIGEEKVPNVMVDGANYVAWVVVSVVLGWVLLS